MVEMCMFFRQMEVLVKVNEGVNETRNYVILDPLVKMLKMFLPERRKF